MKSSLCDHQNVAKGTASPNMYKKIKSILLKSGMKKILEKKLKDGRIKFRFESWDEIKLEKNNEN